MPQNNYVKVKIGEFEASYTKPDDIPIALNFQLEDLENFQIKKAGTSFGIVVPATPANDDIANTFHNPNVEDLTAGEVFRNFQPYSMESNGVELQRGKAVLDEATHTDKPETYKFDCYGDNADWALPLAELTIYDLLKDKTIEFSKANIEDSWDFDGTDEDLWYVFAPVRYRDVFADGDTNMKPEYMRPAISEYFLIYWAFKSLGYKIKSTFCDTEYFRRMVMPWVWGNFLDSETLNIHKFSASGNVAVLTTGAFTGVIDPVVSNDTTEGGFDNNADYSYDPVTKQCVWHYNTPHYGVITVAFYSAFQWDISIDATKSCKIDMVWEVNGGALLTRTIFNQTGAGGGSNFSETFENFESFNLNNGDDLRLKIVVTQTSAGGTFSSIVFTRFKMDFIRVPVGGTVLFEAFMGFQKVKWLDFFKGVCDKYNLMFNTDPVKKEIVIEPLHDYSLDNDLGTKSGGYFNNDFVDWENKQDLIKASRLSLYRDHARELTFRFKDDTQDGIMKIVQDRYRGKVASCKFLFPERFTKDKKDFENRFFSAVMHFDVQQWTGITGTAPQMIVLVPENRANTSQSEAENTFAPKTAYYKGVVSGVGGWTWDGSNQTDFPYMFAVNYKSGGEDDPILSYCDELIDGVIGKGLLKRFFWQRLAIMRNGQWYDTWFHLNNNDVQNIYHREHKKCRGQRWELIKIEGYRPHMEETTKCFLRKWSPITEYEKDNTYPSEDMVSAYPLYSASHEFDVRYNPLKCFRSDLFL